MGVVKYGNPNDDDTIVGPLISQQQLQKLVGAKQLLSANEVSRLGIAQKCWQIVKAVVAGVIKLFLRDLRQGRVDFRTAEFSK